MSTRGLIGTRTNTEFLKGIYNHSDSYYDHTGEHAVENYFDGGDILQLVEERGDGDSREFLYDGLFCEYAYIYNQENDTLEIYRGFFKNKQNLELEMELAKAIANKDTDKINAIKTLMVVEEEHKDTLPEGKSKYFCHLVMIVDKKIHTQEQVLKAFKEYNGEDEDTYPERNIIPLLYNKELRSIV
jgi:hypothetical protein